MQTASPTLTVKADADPGTAAKLQGPSRAEKGIPKGSAQESLERPAGVQSQAGLLGFSDGDAVFALKEAFVGNFAEHDRDYKQR